MISDKTENMHLVGIRPCLRCGSMKLKGWDWWDEFFEILCDECGLQHTGAFGADTVRSWNAAATIEDLRPIRKQSEDRRKQ